MEFGGGCVLCHGKEGIRQLCRRNLSLAGTCLPSDDEGRRTRGKLRHPWKQFERLHASVAERPTPRGSCSPSAHKIKLFSYSFFGFLRIGKVFLLDHTRAATVTTVGLNLQHLGLLEKEAEAEGERPGLRENRRLVTNELVG